MWLSLYIMLCDMGPSRRKPVKYNFMLHVVHPWVVCTVMVVRVERYFIVNITSEESWGVSYICTADMERSSIMRIWEPLCYMKWNRAFISIIGHTFEGSSEGVEFLSNMTAWIEPMGTKIGSVAKCVSNCLGNVQNKHIHNVMVQNITQCPVNHVYHTQ